MKGKIIVANKDSSFQLISHSNRKSIGIVIRETIDQHANPPS